MGKFWNKYSLLGYKILDIEGFGKSLYTKKIDSNLLGRNFTTLPIIKPSNKIKLF